MNVREIERAIVKTYRKELKSAFIKAIKEYDMIRPGDRIAVAISGGKDSLLMAKLFQELSTHGIKNFEAVYISMDPGFRPEIKKRLKELYAFLEIPVVTFDTDVFQVTEYMTAGKSPCYMCARMRRGALYGKAQELGCNKLALGHHFDDVIETTMMNILCAGSYKTMMPKLKADNFENMELIRPLYYIREKDIVRFKNFTGLEPIDCACEVAEKRSGNKRFAIKKLIESLNEEFLHADMNIFRSAENVNMEAILRYKKNGEYHSFLEEYD